MRYEISMGDYIDCINIGLPLEGLPFAKVYFKEQIVEERLRKAVECALIACPIFKCEIFYDKKERTFHLETIKEDFKIFNVKEEDRPHRLYKDTNKYFWQVCYYENELVLEMSHTLCDGRGAMVFFNAILEYYFDARPSDARTRDASEFKNHRGMESLEGLIANPYKEKVQEAPTPSKYFVTKKYKSKTAKCNIVTAPLDEILKLSKSSDASPIAILLPIMARSLRKYIKGDRENKNIGCGFPIDARPITKKESDHNFYQFKQITYVDRFDDFPIEKVATIFRAQTDILVNPDNVIASSQKHFAMYETMRKKLGRLGFKILMLLNLNRIKNNYANIVFTYLGKITKNEKVMENVLDVYFRIFTSLGQVQVAGCEINGNFNLSICDILDGDYTETFIEEAKKYGINFKRVKEEMVFQSYVKDKNM